MKRFIPILDWLPSYKRTYLKGDVFAGLTVSIILIPQGIAYAMIVGIPPIYGLYCALIPQLVYAIFGTSRQVAIGPVAMDSLIVATGVSSLALRGSESYIAIAIMLGLVVGIVQFLMGVLRLGFIVNFLSKPVLSGFSSAVALLIGLNQFKNLFGVDFSQSDEIQVLLTELIENIPDFNLHTTIIGGISCAIIYSIRKVNRKIPSALIVIILGVLVMKFFADELMDIEVIGEIPSGLPSFSVPTIDNSLIGELLPTIITLVAIGFLELISIGKTLEAKQEDYRVRANQELIALGLSNVVGAFFKSYGVTSSFSRSAINQETGGKTGVSAVVSVLMVMLTLLFLTPVFAYLPKTILASIIIVAVFNLIQVSEAKRLFKVNKFDFWLMICTFISTLVLNIEYGILIGVLLSLMVIIYRTSNPYVAELGKVPNANFYRNKERFDEVLISNEVLVFRFDAQLFYANSGYFRDKLEDMTKAKGKALKLIVLDAESINRIDSTGVDMLIDRVKYYQKRGVLFYFGAVKSNVKEVFYRGGLMDIINDSHFFMRVNDAVSYYKTGNNKRREKYAKYIHT